MQAVNEAVSLRVLGAGSAFSGRYGTTCSVLTLPSGDRWLLDCGRQAPEQLKEAGVSWHSVAGQLVTHVHGDHVFGLEEFALVRYYKSDAEIPAVAGGGLRPQLVTHSAVLRELWEVLGPTLRYRSDGAGRPVTGALEDYFEVAAPTGSEPPVRSPWNHSERFELGELSVVARETQHIHGKPSVSFEIHLPGDSERLAWWSGDSNVDLELLYRLAPRTTVFFHDCTFSTQLGQVHGAFEDFAKLPKDLRHRIVLMHHEDDVESHRARVESLGLRLCMPGDVFDLTSGKLLSSS